MLTRRLAAFSETIKPSLKTLFVISQLASLTAISALARPVKIPPPPPAVITLDGLLALLATLPSFILP